MRRKWNSMLLVSAAAITVAAIIAAPLCAQSAGRKVETHEIRIEPTTDGEPADARIVVWLDGERHELNSSDELQDLLDTRGLQDEIDIRIDGQSPERKVVALRVKPERGGDLQSNPELFVMRPLQEEGGGDGVVRLASPTPNTEPGAMLGVRLATLSDELRKYLELDNGEGVMVESVIDETPAAEAGIEARDVIIAARQADAEDFTPVNDESLRAMIAASEPGDELELRFLRKGDEQTLSVTLAEWDAERLGGAPSLDVDEELFTLDERLDHLSELAPQLRVEPYHFELNEELNWPQLREQLDVTPELRELLDESADNHDDSGTTELETAIKRLEERLDRLDEIMTELRRQQEDLEERIEQSER